ncbi:Pantoate-beta-alanine ligase [Rhodofomes roseus]|uniref:Pantoate--beta-alanine ligase n=1 Tax=Rhodofomes roseus TaxID=34475 RepID=A0A4Y9YG37_9APHY|nr:Pantoate-beta-alanine ligase [Rhodofomes roseus]KAH9832619.1 Pantoate-beta-alanine ligase [Rhodofomes roseus]TFY60663.1 hypothetical protein EVJ58_g5007 [Rhodofomes roseus]
MSSAKLPECSIPIFTTVASYREWRREAHDAKQKVGFVATMGALHDGHLALVKRSLAENDLTVLSIFVNPAQFAPHEDLATYPSTLPRDLELLSAMSLPVNVQGSNGPLVRKPSAVFLPTVLEMYPSGISQTISEQKGTFVDVKGYEHQMEGKSRPTFFRGVATVVTKLFNAIEPTQTYFGQKDIQQALLLRRMTRDMLLSHPLPDKLHIVPTVRDLTSSLALSSRNAYLTPHEREVAAPVLHSALQVSKTAWQNGASKQECIRQACTLITDTAEKANASGGDDKIDIRLDYIELNDPETFDVLPEEASRAQWESEGSEGKGRPVILSGAMWVGRTRLIDNIILGDTRKLGIIE